MKRRDEAIYRDFREVCRPPMIRLASFDIGDVWFYDGLSCAVTACVGPQSLLVAYDLGGSGDEVIDAFREADAWLHGRRDDAPKGLHLVYAARERADGTLDVKRFRIGDWSALTDHRPLPPGAKPRLP